MKIDKAHGEGIQKIIAQEVVSKTKDKPAAQKNEPEFQIPNILLPEEIEDVVDISGGTKKKEIDWQKKLEEMRNEMRALREELKRAREAGEGAAEAWKVRIKCLQIAMRIMSGDKVPDEDHRYLREKDPELYGRSITLRIKKKDPKEYDRLSEDERDGSTVYDPARAATAEAAAQPGEAEASPAGAAEPPAETAGTQ